MTDRVLRDVKAWRDLAQLMPGWRPTHADLQKLDDGPHELGVAIRSIARGWSRDDARWDVLQGVLELYKRQHAHELAGRVREAAMNWGGVPDMDALDAADLIDPAVVSRDAEGNPA